MESSLDTPSDVSTKWVSMDSDTVAFLTGINAGNAPAWEELTIEQARTDLRQAMMACSAPAPPAAEQDVTFRGPAGDLTLRIYSPNSETPPPVVLLYHGGGGCLGDLNSYDNFARGICAGTKSIVASVDYRLAPEHKFPAGLEDCHAALCWIQDNASQLGGDAARIALLGDSSGANLAASVCHSVAQTGGKQPAAQVLLYPLLDLRADTAYPSRKAFGAGDYYISEASISWAVDHYLRIRRDALTPAASPVLARNFAGLPRTLIVTAGHDPLKDDGETYFHKLRAAAVPADYRCFESTIHGFLAFNGVIAAGQDGMTFVSNWLNANL